MTAWESLTSGTFEGGDILSQVVVADDGGQGIWSVRLSLSSLISQGKPSVWRSLPFIRPSIHTLLSLSSYKLLLGQRYFHG